MHAASMCAVKTALHGAWQTCTCRQQCAMHVRAHRTFRLLEISLLHGALRCSFQCYLVKYDHVFYCITGTGQGLDGARQSGIIVSSLCAIMTFVQDAPASGGQLLADDGVSSPPARRAAHAPQLDRGVVSRQSPTEVITSDQQDQLDTDASHALNPPPSPVHPLTIQSAIPHH